MTLPCGALLRRPAEAAIRLASSCNSRDHLPPPDLAAGDPAEDESASRHAAGAPAESPTDQCDGVGISRLPRDVNVRVRLAAFDAIAHLRVEDDAGAVIDGVALFLATGAEAMSFMNAPLPTFTSSTTAFAPAAIFFDITLEAMSGIAGTVPVVSRRA